MSSEALLFGLAVWCWGWGCLLAFMLVAWHPKDDHMPQSRVTVLLYPILVPLALLLQAPLALLHRERKPKGTISSARPPRTH